MQPQELFKISGIDLFKILSKYKVRAPETVPFYITLLEEEMLASITICEISFGYII